MRARVSKWGNSLAIRLPHAAVKSLRLHEGEQVELSIKDDRLEVRAAQPRYRLGDLIDEITPENQP
jgi:antitoxin MazE